MLQARRWNVGVFLARIAVSALSQFMKAGYYYSSYRIVPISPIYETKVVAAGSERENLGYGAGRPHLGEMELANLRQFRQVVNIGWVPCSLETHWASSPPKHEKPLSGVIDSR
jgi:hypothetical protein